VQTALKLTLPGMPDIYQGTELWDLSLVDPDNRRPVDYGLRTRLLEEVSAALARDRAGTAAAMLEGWHDGRLKLALTATLLAHRREHPALYAEGAYEPVAASGRRPITCVPSLAVMARARCWSLPPVSRRGWRPSRAGGDTTLAWPQASRRRDALARSAVRPVVERRGGVAAAGALVGEQPVAVLTPDTKGGS
jgi:(1->4)-alpha-D-glucan 1-alpha-D-glucosylmutase